MTNIIGSTKITLNNGKSMPVVGLGTWQSKPGQVRAAVEAAIDVGYRHIDGAYYYDNEKEVGEALQVKLKEGVRREDLFIVSKVWSTHHSEKDVRVSTEKTLKDLQLDYLDLLLIHFPMAFQAGGELTPVDKDGNTITTDVHYKETWKAMEDLVDAGLIKSIGLSNFNSKQIDEVCEMSRIKPAVLQCESHPYLNQNKLIEHCKKHGIVFTAYSPLGSPAHPAKDPSKPVLLENPVINDIGKKYNKSAAQICIKYQIQRGAIVLPKSVTPSRIQANAEVFDFCLSDDDMQKIESLNINVRYYTFNRNIVKEGDEEKVIAIEEHALYPFNIPY